MQCLHLTSALQDPQVVRFFDRKVRYVYSVCFADPLSAHHLPNNNSADGRHVSCQAASITQCIVAYMQVPLHQQCYWGHACDLLPAACHAAVIVHAQAVGTMSCLPTHTHHMHHAGFLLGARRQRTLHRPRLLPHARCREVPWGAASCKHTWRQSGSNDDAGPCRKQQQQQRPHRPGVRHSEPEPV